MTFFPRSSLEWIGIGWIKDTQVEDISVHGSDNEPFDLHFAWCLSVYRVKDCPNSFLEFTPFIGHLFWMEKYAEEIKLLYVDFEFYERFYSKGRMGQCPRIFPR